MQGESTEGKMTTTDKPKRKNLKQITDETYQAIAESDTDKGISQLERCIEEACDSEMGIGLRKKLISKFDQFIKSRTNPNLPTEARGDARNNLIETLAEASEYTEQPMAGFGAQEMVRDFEKNYLQPALDQVRGTTFP